MHALRHCTRSAQEGGARVSNGHLAASNLIVFFLDVCGFEVREIMENLCISDCCMICMETRFV
jgi:hypothetical protein